MSDETHLWIALLGPFDVRWAGRPVAPAAAKQRALLAVLALRPNEPVGVDELVERVWTSARPSRASKTVQVNVARLRAALGEGGACIVTTPGGYRLKVDHEWVDLGRFERLLAAGQGALAGGAVEAAAEQLAEALRLWRGPALADFVNEEFAQDEIRRLDALRLTAQEARIEADLRLGRHGQVVTELDELAREHPERERLHAHHLLALYRCGRQTEALEGFQRARRTLVDELGLEPGPELRRLHDAILRHDPALDYRPADTSAAPQLVGRARELAALREHWQRARAGTGGLVAISGAPGVGKTRLATEFAAEARTDGAHVAVVSDPAELARASHATRPTLVVVDGGSRELRTALDELELTRAPVLVLAIGAHAGAPRIALDPLDGEQVRDLAAFYAPGCNRDEIPAEHWLENTGGDLRRVHELARVWACREAARRVDVAARRAEAGRTELYAAEAQLTDDIVGLQAVRDRFTDTGDPGRAKCPFKGLAAFEAADADYFFGRDRLVAELVTRVIGTPLLAIIGASGSGKSSVLRAGLLPALRDGVVPGSEQWPQTLQRPGEHPKLEPGGRDARRVLAIDQFEEVFTACRDEHERAGFIAALTRASDQGALVVLAMRADFYGRCAAYPDLARLMGANHVLVPPLQPAELRRAIEGPAQRVGLQVESELVEALLADVATAPGALPLLSTALLELWQHQDARRLRLTAYERTGGVKGAVARLAEQAYAGLDTNEQSLARGVFLRLVAESPEGVLVRRGVAIGELQPGTAGVVEQLTDHRLLTASAETVEVAHEALLREWPRLRAWLEDDQEGRRLHRHLTTSANAWHDHGDDPADLYRGARLAAAREWRSDHEDELNEAERAFLGASAAAERQELELAHRRTRRFRALALTLTGVAVLAVLASMFALSQSRRADAERRTAVSRSLAVEALAQLDQSRDLAALLSLEAYRTKPTVEARNAVLTVLPELERAAGELETDDQQVALAFHPNDSLLATAGGYGAVRLWNTATGRPVGRPLEGHTNTIRALAFDRDGEALASVGEDGIVRVWDVATRRPLRAPLSGLAGSPLDVVFGREGTLSVVTESGSVWRWDVATGRLHKSLSSRTIVDAAFDGDGTTMATVATDGSVRVAGASLRRAGFATAVAVNRAGTAFATAAGNGAIQIWDVATRRPLGPSLTAHVGPVSSLAFNTDGTVLVSGGMTDGTLRLWDIATGKPLGAPITGHTGALPAVGISRDGTMLASADDAQVRLSYVATGRTFARPVDGHGDTVTTLAFDPAGKRLASAGEDRELRVWDVATGRPVGEPIRHTQVVRAVAFSRDGSTLTSVDTKGTTRRWDVAAGRLIGVPQPSREDFPFALALSADGTLLASAGVDDAVQLTDLTGRRPSGPPLRGHAQHIVAIAFSPDATTLASASLDGTARLWDMAARRPLGPALTGHSGHLVGVAFSRDGTMLASASSQGAVRLWEVEGRRPLGRPLKGHDDAIGGVAFTPNTATLASVSGGSTGTLRFWDIASRRALGGPLAIESSANLAFSPDGRTLATAEGDTIWLWDSILWSDEGRALRQRVCKSVDRELTRAEWTQFLPDESPRRTC